MNDLACNNDLVTNGVNGTISNKTWGKCECCTPMETSTGVYCLEIPEISKSKFSSTSCLNNCRSDPHFAQWSSWQENFISSMISTQCWSFAKQTRSVFFQKSIRLDWGAPLLLKSNILSSESLKVAMHRCTVAFSISHFSSLEVECTEAVVYSCFSE